MAERARPELAVKVPGTRARQESAIPGRDDEQDLKNKNNLCNRLLSIRCYGGHMHGRSLEARTILPKPNYSNTTPT